MTNNLEGATGQSKVYEMVVMFEEKAFEAVGVTDAVIAQWKRNFLPLKIAGIEDKAGYKRVHEARMVMKNTRVNVEKEGLRLRKKARSCIEDYLAKEQTEEARILAEMEPIESHLLAEEKAIDVALEAIKQEAARKEEERIQARIVRLEGYGMGLIAGLYKLPFDAPGVAVPTALVKVVNDEQFEKFCSEIQAAIDAENVRKAEEEARRQAEEKRLAEELQKLAAEQARLEAIRLENEKSERERRIREAVEKSERERQEAELRAEQEKIRRERLEWERLKADELREQEAAKQKVIDDKRRAEEMEQAKAEAAEKARIQAIEDAKREAEEKKQAEEKTRIVAERKAARAPDKVKLLAYADSFSTLHCTMPLKTGEAKDILIRFDTAINDALASFRLEVEEAL